MNQKRKGPRSNDRPGEFVTHMETTMRKQKRKLSKTEMLNRQIASWEKKQEDAVIMLRKSAEMLLKLRRKRSRMLAKVTAEMPSPKPQIETDHLSEAQFEEAVAQIAAEHMPPSAKDNGIPTFLDRTRKLAAMADPRTKEKKAERRAVEKEVREAEITGKRRKLPLTGKAALDAIRK